MISKIALAAASLAAALTLAFALFAAGFTPGQADPVSNVSTTVEPAADPSVQVDTIYVAPPVEPETITITQPSGGDEYEDDDEEHESGEHEDEEDD